MWIPTLYTLHIAAPNSLCRFVWLAAHVGLEVGVGRVCNLPTPQYHPRPPPPHPGRASMLVLLPGPGANQAGHREGPDLRV